MEEKTLEMEQEQTAVDITYEELPDAPANDTIPIGKILVAVAGAAGAAALIYSGVKGLVKKHKEKKASKEEIVVEAEEISEEESEETEKTE